MKQKILLGRSFNWRMLLMRFIVNLVALSVTLLLVPQINLVKRDLVTWLWLALVAGAVLGLSGKLRRRLLALPDADRGLGLRLRVGGRGVDRAAAALALAAGGRSR